MEDINGKSVKISAPGDIFDGQVGVILNKQLGPVIWLKLITVDNYITWREPHELILLTE